MSVSTRQVIQCVNYRLFIPTNILHRITSDTQSSLCTESWLNYLTREENVSWKANRHTQMILKNMQISVRMVLFSDEKKNMHNESLFSLFPVTSSSHQHILVDLMLRNKSSWYVLFDRHSMPISHSWHWFTFTAAALSSTHLFWNANEKQTNSAAKLISVSCS